MKSLTVTRLNFLYLLLSINIVCAVLLPDISDIAFALMFLSGVCFLVISRDQWSFSGLDKAEKVLFVSFSLFTAISIASYFYWPSNRYSQMRLEDYGTFLLMLPFYWVLKAERIQAKAVVMIFAISSLLVGLVGALQVGGDALGQSILGINMSQRATGGVNPMRFAGVSLLLACFLVCWLIVRRSKRVECVLLLLAAMAGCIAMLLTWVRGSWIAVPFVGVLFLWFLVSSGKIKQAVVVAIMGGGSISLFVQTEVFQNRFDKAYTSVERYFSGDTRSTPVTARLDMYKAAVQLIKERPIWGHGLNTYSPKATEIREATSGMSREVGRWNNPHNEILQVMVEKGVIGLVALILIFVIPWRICWKAVRSKDSDSQYYGLCGLCLLIVFAVTGQTMALFEHDEYNHFFVVLVLLFVSQIKRIESGLLIKNRSGISVTE